MNPERPAGGFFSLLQKPGKAREWILLSVLLLPVFFINVKASHSWDGDFALYILQARNLVEGKAQTATGYIFNEQGFLPSPQTYPVGFPILLAPLYVFFGNDILAFSYFISLVLFMLGLVMYHFFRTCFSRSISAGAVLLIIYNPWTLAFKGEILADLPFMLMMLLGVVFYVKLDGERRAFATSLWLGLWTAFSMLLKSIGIVLLLAVLVDLFFLAFIKLVKGKINKPDKSATNLLVAAASALLFYAAIAFILIPTAKEPLPYYQSLYSLRHPLSLIIDGMKNYVHELEGFFYLGRGGWKVLTFSTIALASMLMAVGFIAQCIKRPGMIEWLTAAFSFAVLTFPTANQGLRYLFPILPIYFYYAILGAQALRLGGRSYAERSLILLAALCLFHYPSGIGGVLREQGRTTAGPQERQSLEAFRYIRANTPGKAVFAFIKATVLPLYTGRSCIANRRDQDSASMAMKFAQVGVGFYLTHADLANPALDKFLLRYQNEIKLVWVNDKFKLYKRIE
jgi:hypothetical protein